MRIEHVPLHCVHSQKYNSFIKNTPNPDFSSLRDRCNYKALETKLHFLLKIVKNSRKANSLKLVAMVFLTNLNV